MSNRDEIREEGLALFIVSNSFNEKIYFEDWLPARINKYRNEASMVLSLRNILIIMTIVEIFASIWGFSYFFIRRSLIYVFVNVSLFFISLLGVYAVIAINDICLMIYSLFLTSIPGTFFLYQIFEFFAINDTKGNVNTRLNDNILLFIFSIPYIYDFIVGIITIVFLWRISEFNVLLKQIVMEDDSQRLLKENNENLRTKYSEEQLQKIFKLREEKKNSCVICMDVNREIMCYPCGHLLLCNQCKNEYERNFIISKPTCPVCRSNIEKFVTVRNA